MRDWSSKAGETNVVWIVVGVAWVQQGYMCAEWRLAPLDSRLAEESRCFLAAGSFFFILPWSACFK